MFFFFFFRILSSFCCDKWRKRNRAFQREEITVSFFRNGNYALLFSVAGNVSDFSRLPRATFYSACMSFLSRCNAAFFFFYCCSAYFLLNLSVVAEMLRPYMLRQPFFVLPLLNHHSFYQKAAKIEIQCCLYCYYYAAKDCLFFSLPFIFRRHDGELGWTYYKYDFHTAAQLIKYWKECQPYET